MTKSFDQVLAALGNAPGVTRGRMFGSDGLKFGGRVFAMEVKGRLVVKLSAARVAELVASGCERFDPGHGRLMREWASVPVDGPQEWVSLAQEALRSAGGSRQLLADCK